METQEILRKLQKYRYENATTYGIRKIGIFGSYARGEAKENSDIDICIVMDRPDLFRMVHIREDLQRLFDRSIDLVRIRERMNPYLKRRIEEEALYA